MRVTQLTLAVLLALGDVLEWGSDAATAQIVSVLSLQLGLALLLFVVVPGLDRFECLGMRTSQGSSKAET